MAQGLRKRGKKIVIYILMSILVLSFVGFGVEGLFNQPAQDTVIAEVGGENIYAGELEIRARREYEKYKSIMEVPPLSIAIQMGLLRQALDSYINDAAFNQLAKKQGIVVDDETIKKAIIDNDQFKQGGVFDKKMFLETLKINGFTEDQYIQILEQNYKKWQIAGAITAGPYIPKDMLAGTYRFLNEERQADYVVFPLVKKESLTQPTNQEIEDYYQTHQEQFRVPELRSFQVLLISPEKIAETVEVSEEKIKNYYDMHLTNYKQEQALYLQVAQFKTKEEAEKAVDQLKNSEDFVGVASKLTGRSKETIDLGWIHKSDLIEAVATQLAALKKGEISQPIEGVDDWRIYRVVDRRDAEHKDLSEVKVEIHKAVAREMATQQIANLSQQVDDALGRGEKLTDIAKEFKLQLVDVKDVDQSGRIASGTSSIDMEIAQAAFKLSPGEDSLLETLTDGGRFVVHLEKITPSTIDPLVNVQETIRQQLLKQKQIDETRQEIRKAVKDINEGTSSFADWAKKLGLTVQQTEKMTRLNLIEQSKNLPETFKGQIFDRNDDGITVYDDKDKFFVAKVTYVQQPDVDLDVPMIQDLRNQLSSSVRDDLHALFVYALRNDLGTEFNKEAYAELYGKLSDTISSSND